MTMQICMFILYGLICLGMSFTTYYLPYRIDFYKEENKKIDFFFNWSQYIFTALIICILGIAHFYQISYGIIIVSLVLLQALISIVNNLWFTISGDVLVFVFIFGILLYLCTADYPGGYPLYGIIGASIGYILAKYIKSRYNFSIKTLGEHIVNK